MQEFPRSGPLAMQWVAVGDGARPRMEMRWVAPSSAPVAAPAAVPPLSTQVTHAA